MVRYSVPPRRTGEAPGAARKSATSAPNAWGTSPASAAGIPPCRVRDDATQRRVRPVLFVVDPGVAPTNSLAGQLLRGPAIVRKIHDSLRAERGAMVLSALLPCMTTRERQGQDSIIELKLRI